MNNNERIRQLYEDAIYWHLISKGYPEGRARSEAMVRAKKMESFIEKSV